jgi:hypothetical protein
MFDPIFQGMAVSVFFGASVGTVLAVIVIPLGCITMRRRFYMVETETGEIELSQRYFETEVGAAEVGKKAPAGLIGGAKPALPAARKGPRPTPVWMRVLLWVWGVLVSGLFSLFGALAALVAWVRRRVAGARKPSRGPRSGPVKPGPSGAPPGGPATPAAAGPAAGIPPAAPALGGAQARAGEVTRTPSFAAEPDTTERIDLQAAASESGPDPASAATGPQPVGAPATEAPASAAKARPANAQAKKRSTRKTPVEKNAPGSETGAPVPETGKTARRKTASEKPAPKKVAPAPRAARPRGGNGKAPRDDRGPLDG